MNRALFVISTGRCGTQSLADMFERRLGDRVIVTHEPMHNDYGTREMLGVNEPDRLDPDLSAPLLDHIDFIEEMLQSKPYIECGHPSWSSIPYLVRRFEGRISFIHLVRHPVPTAFSWLTHFAYLPPPAPHLEEKVLLTPFDDGIRFTSYRERWPSLTPFEKALFYWLEVNTLAFELLESETVSSMRIRCEELSDASMIDRVLTFAGFDVTSGDATSIEQVDRYRSISSTWCDPRLVERHPDVIELATRLGYDALPFDELALRRRYRRG